ncbi:MAG: cytochrome c [Bacteroidota bacterium]
MTKKELKNILLIGFFAILLYACQDTGLNKTGSEYMPDMAHSIAVEANTHNYYFANTWNEESVLPLDVTSVAKLPVKGTIPRYDVRRGNAIYDPEYVATTGSVPYHYGDSEEERARATEEIMENPFPITERGLARGKELYNLFCAVCHGSQAQNGDGIYASGAYPLAPANMVLDSSVAFSSPGRYYHAIMYGKNAMGAYKGKMSYEERWQVIHYIRQLQAKHYEKVYSEEENTLNSYGVTFAAWTDKVAAYDRELAEQMEEAVRTDSVDSKSTINAVDQPQIPGSPRTDETER